MADFERTTDMFFALLRPKEWGTVIVPFHFAASYKAAIAQSRTGHESAGLERALRVAETTADTLDGKEGYFTQWGRDHAHLAAVDVARASHDRAVQTFGKEYLEFYARFSSVFPPSVSQPSSPDPRRFDAGF